MIKKYTDKLSGYVFVYVDKYTWVAEHRLVMEKNLGRKLTSNEIPHHKDESFEGRSNNDISNLELMTRAEHQKHHGKDRRHSYFISFDKVHGRWHLYIRNGDEFKAFGYYDTEEDAINAFKTGTRVNRHDEMNARQYRIYFHVKLNKWQLFVKQKDRRVDGQRKEKSFGLYNTKEDALKAFESGVKIDRRIHAITY